jgi:UDP-N-acetylmuramoyl-L-alanyl-D-glutamate--2,6-diaminopimelate ligase
VKLSALIDKIIAPDPEITGLASDSRAVKPGFLFAALPGVKLDGAAFARQAVENGAAAVLARAGLDLGVPVIVEDNPRQRLAMIAARFYPRQPEMVVGVTGTNGKTSTVRFFAQIWAMLGEKAGSIGTLGASAPGFERKLQHTTPDPILLHEMLDAMARAGVTRAAMEVSSHALVQHRADGVRFSAAAFTNITQDHFDYHAGFDDYLAAKLRLFTELTPKSGFAAVNADGEGAGQVIAAAKAAGLGILTTGARGDTLRLTRAVPHATGLSVDIAADGETFPVELPLVGAFQAENALLAAALVIGSGVAARRVIPLLAKLDGVPGRMQKVASSADGAAVYVDYAHTPNAIATALAAIRPHARKKLVAIIGAGGDRDSSKRPHMGRAAALGADAVIVTDDNPRSEEPAEIRRQVLKGAPKAIEIGDRAEAIARGVAMLGPGDVLLIAGKGHETGQTIGDRTLPFDDAEVARKEAAKREGFGR